MPRVQQAIKAASIEADFVQLDGTSVRARFQSTDTQLKAKDAIDKALNPDAADPSYIVALNLLSRSPHWLSALHALPMYLGLDLRGGVRFPDAGRHEGATKRLDAGPATSAPCCATRTCATPASRATATTSTSAA